MPTHYCASCGRGHAVATRRCARCGSPLTEAEARRHMLGAAHAQRRAWLAHRCALALLLVVVALASVAVLHAY
jgi:uncharacterized membrane protein YvbJ